MTIYEKLKNKNVDELAKKKWEQNNAERCIICNEIIPEGQQVCPICEKNIRR